MAEGIAVKRRAEARLFAIPGVHTVGFGAKVTAGKPVGEFAIIVQVSRKKLPGEVLPFERIPSEIDGLKTDVVEASALRVRQSVLQGGDEIDADYGGVFTSGTLGCLGRLAVPDSAPPDVLISNHHVLYLKETDPPGADVKIPSCSGCCHTTVAKVLDGPKINADIDAALAKFIPGVDTKAQIHNIPIKGILDLTDPKKLPTAIQKAIQDQTYQVYKYGAKTGFTRGQIDFVDASGGTVLPNSKQIQITPLDREFFSKEGDSGAVVYNDSNEIVGLLWGHGGGTQITSFACHITTVLAAFPGLRIAKNPPETIYRTPGIRKLPPMVERVHRDLAASGCIDYYVGLYGKHLEEFRWLFAHSRHFVSAWHRNHGPKIVRALMDLVEDRIAVLPATFEERLWSECLYRIGGALLYTGSARLQADVVRYLTFSAGLGGRKYADILQLMRALAMVTN
jgi:hypothetical protein